MFNSGKNIVEVGIAMVLRDQFSKESGRISNSFKTMMNDMSTWSRGIQMSGSSLADYGAQVLKSMYRAYEYSAGVQNEIWMASKIAGATQAEQNRLLQVAKQVNEETPLTAMQVSSAARYLAMAGNKADAIEKMIPPVAKLASILNIDPGGKGGVADMMTNIMSMFQIPMGDAAKVSDDLYTATTNANISLEDLAATIRYSGADMKAAGVSMRELAAATGVLGDMGIQGSMAGTSLGNMVRNLQLSLSEQKKLGSSWLKELGLTSEDFYDAQGGFKGLYNAFQQFLDSYKQMTAMGRTQAFYNIFGVRGMRGIIPILNDMASGRDKMNLIMGLYDKNQGIVDQKNEERLNTMAGKLDQMNSAFENLVVTVGNKLAPLFNPIVDSLRFLTKLADNLASLGGMGKFLIQTMAVGTAVTVIVNGYRTIAMTLRMIRTFHAAANTVANGMTGATSRTNQQFAIMEMHLVRIGNIMRDILILQMQMAGLSRNSAGQWIWTKTGRYAKVPKTIFDPFDPMAGNISGGNGSGAGSRMAGGGSLLAGGTSKFARWALGKGLSRGVIKGVGTALTAVSTLGKILPGWGWAFTLGVPLLTSLLDKNSDSLDNNTRALEESRRLPEAAIQARNQQAFIDAVKVAIRDGFKESNIGITVDGESVGTWTPGTSNDYTGGTLLGIN